MKIGKVYSVQKSFYTFISSNTRLTTIAQWGNIVNSVQRNSVLGEHVLLLCCHQECDTENGKVYNLMTFLSLKDFIIFSDIKTDVAVGKYYKLAR
jgi:hypothetical protein